MALTGSEILYVQGLDATGAPAATLEQTTTGAVAAISGSGVTSDIINTSITTVGAGTLTAAAILGGLITRTGPVAAYSDATDSAANMLTAIGTFVSGATFFVTIKNLTAFTQTITAGANVTLPGSAVVGAFEEVEYFGTVGGTVAAPTITFSHIQTVPIALAASVVSPQITTLATNGAGTLLAAAINGGYINRTTVAAAFADTTDTAALIIAGNPGLISKIGASFIFVYANNSTGVATMTGGMGVTVSGVITIPPGVAVQYLLTYTAAATITMVGIGSTEISPNTLVVGGATSGQVTIEAPAVAGTAALTLPPNAAGTLASTSGANLAVIDVYRCGTAQTANTNIVPANIMGLSGAVAVGTYEFEASIYCTIASGTGGVAINQLLTTAVLGACNFQAMGYTASAVAVQATTTATSGTVLFTQAAVVIEVMIKGTFTVTTAGTFGLQMCQSASNASNSVVNVGSTMRLTRIA